MSIRNLDSMFDPRSVAVVGASERAASVAFYATDSLLPFWHLIWHLFVLAGTACHYVAVLWYAA